MTRLNSQKKYYWIILLSCFLLSGRFISATSADKPSSDLVINEFMAANGTSLTDEDEDYSDWIEIYNRGNSALNLAGWALTDDPNQPQKWPFPDMTLGSHEYLVVFASGKNRSSIEPGTALHTNFKLNKSGDFLALHNILEGKFMDSMSPHYPEQFRDVSYGRYGHDLAFGYLTTPTPGEPNEETFASTGSVASVSFSVERGFYEAPFTVELTSDTPEATIRYTIDGSEPTERNGTVYSGPIAVRVTTLLRAAAFKSGYLSSAVTTQTYIFPDDVLTQFALSDSKLPDFLSGSKILSATGGKKPAQIVDKDALKAGLTSIPAVSLVMDDQQLAELKAELDKRGKDSEHAVSVEYIYPDRDEPGTQIDAGIRLYGQNSASVARHSYRLYFRGQYGSTKLEYPLFPVSPVETFDTLVLRAVRHDRAADGADTHNEWLRTSQAAMSGIGAHGLFVNLYLNGRYEGLYNLVERPDANFMSAYLGSRKEDWFVANQAGPLDNDLADTANNLNFFFTAFAVAPSLGNNGFSQPEYLADLYTAAAEYLDQSQLIDYILLNWYAETLDWPQSSWYAAVRLQDLPGRGKLLIGDEQVDYNRQVAFDQPDSPERNIHTAYLETLLQNPDFKVNFADRVYQHLFNDGALSDAKAQARWQELEAAISQAMLTEITLRASAGDDPSLTWAEWRTARRRVLAQMKGRASSLVTQAREAGYYPEFDPPLFSENGALVEAGFELEMSLPPRSCRNCTIYYTIDGSDPRLPITGAIIPNAVLYNSPLVLTTTRQVKARAWDGQAWSALHEATFSVVEQDNKLRITEIMYNPAGGDDYEFIELQNVGNSELDLANISLEDGVRFTFPPNSPPLKPGRVAVLVSNLNAFAEQYPNVAIWGAYEGHLSNKGEKLILKDADGEILIEVAYADDNGWPISADGRGDSLTLVDEAGNPNEPKNWRASIQLNGSPGLVELAN